tara:strand:- start:3352 stop:4371 length:1020 start_codon:yes stop_codon:yes gene_type:complete
MKILVTGCAGFIGYHVSKRILEKGFTLIGFDNINAYYDQDLKNARLRELNTFENDLKGKFIFVKGDLEDTELLINTFCNYHPDIVINLAAQAGVRYSLQNPSVYIQSNLVGFGNILEMCRKNNVNHLIYASSSSVYGGNTKTPFSERDSVDHPISLYAASKKANELMAHSYSHLYNIPTTGLRFFTVYGPWGRPDMALFLFTKNILLGKPIQVFNNGNMIRDFTYIDDIVEGIMRISEKIPEPDSEFKPDQPNPGTSWAPYKIFNIGNSNPIKLMDYIKVLEKELGIKAIIEMKEMQPGDVPYTAAETISLEKHISFKPKTSIEDGINLFVKWYKDFYM